LAPLIDGIWFAIGLVILQVLWLRKKDDWIVKAGAATVETDYVPQVEDEPGSGQRV
jgi:hypothetical protein